MSDEFFVQLFWFIFLVTLFAGILVSGAIIYSHIQRWEYRRLVRHEKARQRWTEVATPAGPIPALLPPGKVDAFTPRMDAVPALGQHTDAILGELGWDAAAIGRLRQLAAI